VSLLIPANNSNSYCAIHFVTEIDPFVMAITSSEATVRYDTIHWRD
jgi:hypothetical protein